MSFDTVTKVDSERRRKMIRTSLCYIEHEGSYLMLLRNKKACDPNEGKWIGIGGKFEDGESPDECMLREVREETGIELREYHFHGIIEFRPDNWEDEDMYLYTAKLPASHNILPECSEGTLRWVAKEDIMKLNLWEGDRIFLKELLDGKRHINMRLVYHGDDLVCAREI